LSSVCRGEVLTGYFIKVEEKMFEGSNVQPGQQARIIIAKADEVEPGPDDSIYYETVIRARMEDMQPTGEGLLQIPQEDGEPILDVDIGDKVIYIMAPVSVIDALPAPSALEDEQTIADIIGVAQSGKAKKPVRNKIQDTVNRSNIDETGGENSTVNAPEPTTDEIVQEDSRVQQTGQVRIKKRNADALGVTEGSPVVVHMEYEGNSITFFDTVGSNRRVIIGEEQANQLGFSLDDAPGISVVMTVERED
jgi:hypothetical protein